jgi:hypothetical protein
MAAFRAEAIGLGPVPRSSRGGHNGDRRQPWVAEVTGTDPRFGLRREFLRPRRDYRDASRTGERGVGCWWTLESGRLYQARYRVTWDQWVTRFVTVTQDGEVADVSEQEALAWASAISAPTS